DYAAASAKALRQWLVALARSVRTAPLRILLLERHGRVEGGWWQRLSQSNGGSDFDVESIFAPPAPILMDKFNDIDQRVRLLTYTFNKAADYLGYQESEKIDLLNDQNI